MIESVPSVTGDRQLGREGALWGPHTSNVELKDLVITPYLDFQPHKVSAPNTVSQLSRVNCPVASWVSSEGGGKMESKKAALLLRVVPGQLQALS